MSEKAFEKKTLKKRDDLTNAQIKKVLTPNIKVLLYEIQKFVSHGDKHQKRSEHYPTRYADKLHRIIGEPYRRIVAMYSKLLERSTQFRTTWVRMIQTQMKIIGFAQITLRVVVNTMLLYIPLDKHHHTQTLLAKIV